MCFVWISEQTAIISLHNIYWLVCITETECVYWAVRTEVLNIIPVNRLAVSRWPLSVEAWFRFQLSPCDRIFVVHKVALRQCFTQNFRFPLSVPFHQCSLRASPTCWTLIEKMGETREPAKKQFSSGNRGPLNRKLLPLYFLSLQSVHLVDFWSLNTFRVISHTLTAQTFISWWQKSIVYCSVKLINQYVINIYDKVEVKLK